MPHLEGPFTFRQVSATDESGKTLISGLDLTIGLREDVVAIGAAGDGAEVVGDLIARLILPSAGSINVGSTSLLSLPEWQTGRRIGYVGPEPFFAHGTARDALLSGLRHAPFRPAPEGVGDDPADPEGGAGIGQSAVRPARRLDRLRSDGRRHARKNWPSRSRRCSPS